MNTDTPKPLGVGLVGWGYASATFHAPLVRATPGLRLVAVSSQRPQTQGSHPWGWVPSTEALLARGDVDLVVIPTPNQTHHPLAAMALAAGKHVVVDKPFTLTVAEAQDLVTRATQAQRVLSVFHNRRWDSDFLTLRAVLGSGVLGRVTHIASHFDRYRPQVRQRWRESADPGAGLWYDLGPHLLDQALQLLGPPEAIWLDAQQQRDGALTDDVFHAVLRYPGQRVVLHASALTAAVAPRWAVHGTEGSYVQHGLDPQEDVLKTGAAPGGTGWGVHHTPGVLTLRDGEGLHTRPAPMQAGDYLAYYAGLQQALATGGPPPVTATEALAVMAWIAAGQRSLQTGAWTTTGTTTDPAAA